MIAVLKPYPEYKPSSQAWLGDVPQHWSVVPNRALFAEVKDRNHPDEEMLSVTITKGIVRQKALLEGSSKKDSSNLDKSAYKLVQPRDIAYNKMRAWQGAIGASALRGIISPAYIVMRLRKEDDLPSYFHHLYRTPQFAKEAERWSYGITSDMWSLRPEHFKMIYTPEPPPAEQAAIVRFLDWANGRLERAIQAKRKVIALLNEQKQAIIHRAVTRGLDPSVPLKPSGIPWLGDIPQHWEVSRLKFLVRKITDGEHISPVLADQGIPLLSAKDVRDRVILMGVDKFVNPEQARQFWRRCRPRQGDVLIVSRGATIGRVAIVESSEPFCLMGSVILCNCREGYSHGFLYYALNAHHAQTSLWFTSASSAQQAIYIKDVAELRLPLPPNDERNVIETHLDDSLAPLHDALSRIEREIELLREYRTRLVADVVTGKLDVREAAARLPDEALPDTVEDDADLRDETEPADEEAAV